MSRTPSFLVLVLACWLAAGCASFHVRVDERSDLSGLATWTWLPSSSAEPPRSAATAALGGNPSDVDPAGPDGGTQRARVVAAIERELARRGFRRSDERPDFYVTYRLQIESRLVSVREPRAIYELSSHHSSPSYIVQADTMASHPYRELRLAIAAIGPQGATLWRAAFSQIEREADARSLEQALAALLDRLPERRSEAGTSKSRSGSGPNDAECPATPSPADESEPEPGDEPPRSKPRPQPLLDPILPKRPAIPA